MSHRHRSGCAELTPMAFGASTRRNRPAARGSLRETGSPSGPRPEETGGQPGRGGHLPQPASWSPEPHLMGGGREGEPVRHQHQGAGLGTEGPAGLCVAVAGSSAVVAVLGQMGPGRNPSGHGQGTCACGWDTQEGGASPTASWGALQSLTWRKRQTKPRRATRSANGTARRPWRRAGRSAGTAATGLLPCPRSGAFLRVRGRGAQMLQKCVV